MSYCELVDRIKTDPLKYIDEYNLLYLRNYLDGYEYFKYLNAFDEKILGLRGYCLTFFIQSKVIEIGNEYVKNELESCIERGWDSLIPFIEIEPKKQFDFFFKCFDEFKTLALEDYDFTPIVRRFDKYDDEIYKLSKIKLDKVGEKIDFHQYINLIRKRVGAYIGDNDLKSLKHDTLGFIYASKELGVKDNFASFYEQKFNNFVKEEVLKNQNINIDSEMDYTKIIPLFVSDPKEQIKTYLMYFDKFVSLYNK